jgi:hypothetical protein
MKIQKPNVILFIEPKNDASKTGIRDNYTLEMEKILKQVMEEAKSGYDNELGWSKNGKYGSVSKDGVFTPNISYMGVHTCICGVKSHSRDYLLPNGYVTNSLAVHYLEFHRAEIPEEEFDKIRKLLQMTNLTH